YLGRNHRQHDIVQPARRQHMQNLILSRSCTSLHQKPCHSLDETRLLQLTVVQYVSTSNIKKLKRVQNTLSRLVTSSSSRCHVTPILADLHWLPVRSRIEYKVALLTFKTMTTQRPTYLQELVQLHRPARPLRSSDHCYLRGSGSKTVFGSRAFCHAAPTVWNSLPSTLTDAFSSMSLNVFKRHLKTHFYSKSYC